MSKTKFKPDIVSALCGSARKYADSLSNNNEASLVSNSASTSSDLEASQDLKYIQKMVSDKIAEEKIEYELDEKLDEWELSKKNFPKQTFPWHILPSEISESLQQLARSCATSPTAIPGAAFAIFASAIGSTVDVSPKKSWTEPLIFWFGDIRPSGSGKTPAARELCKVLYAFQKKADNDYKIKLNDWQNLSAKEKGNPPERARGYFVTDLTLEGLRLEITEHGGIVCVMDELSSFLSSQNQYKNKGNDRECWLNLWDGKPARVVRIKESYTIYNARINLFGGIQPRVWQDFFGGEKGFFLEDGTIYRFLPIYESDSFFPLNSEDWSEYNRCTWENLLTKALEWADFITSRSNWKTINLVLSSESQKYFFDWRNDLFAKKNSLPSSLKGFIPKVVSYALRLAGIIHSMYKFINNSHPGEIITLDDIKKGINIAEFYMGHAVDAVKVFSSGYMLNSIEITEQIICLSESLKTLKDEVDSGRLAVGFICERYNSIVKKNNQMKPKAMGAFLRSCSLNITPGSHNANGRRSVRCLIWDNKLESFLKIIETKKVTK